MSTPTNEYKKVADELKELLIQEYLKTHMDVSREDLSLQCKNGKLVFEYVSDVFADTDKDRRIQKAQAQQDQFLRDIPLEDLVKSQDDRFQDCVLSAKKSKRILQFLSVSNAKSPSSLEKVRLFDRIGHGERSSITFAREIVDCKSRFMQLMDSRDVKATHSLVRTYILELLEATIGLIKTHCSLLKYETNVSNYFLDHTQHLIKKYFKTIKSHTSEKSLQTILKVYKSLETHGSITPLDVKNMNYEVFEATISQFRSLLDQKRNEIERLTKLVDFIEKLIMKVGNQEEGETNNLLQEKKDVEEKKALKHSGMNVIDRVLKRFKR